jgi:hypothetical protein
MAFEDLKAAIPSALIQLLIEKLVAMIVPAAGAVMAIIEGLQAAWPAIQRVIAAVGLFVVFLKAVKPGGAGPQFATMLAAGAVVVIDFVATWLLKKLHKPAGKLGSKVKAIAQKIIARVKKAMKKVGGWVKGKFKGLKQKFADWKAKRKAKKDAKQKGKEDPSKKKQDKEAEKRNRLEKAVGYVTPKVQAMLSRGVNRFVLKSSLLLWRMRFRIRVLRVVQSGTSTHVEAANSPTRITNQWFKKNRNEIYQLIKKIAKERYRGENAVAQPEIAAPFDQVLGLFEAEAGDGPDFLDHLELLVTGRLDRHGELGLLLDRRRGGGRRGHHHPGRHRSGRFDAPGLLEGVHEFDELEHGQARELLHHRGLVESHQLSSLRFLST